MAAPFYNRYIPPQTKGPHHSEPSRPAKKRKKNKPTSTTVSQQAKPREQSEEYVHLNGHVVGQAHRRSPDTDAVQHDVAIRDRHKTVLDKYDKAAKKSTKLTDERIDVAEDDGDERQEEAVDVELHGLEPLPQPAPAKEDRKVSAFSALPEWLQAPIVASSAETVPFQDLALHADVLSSLEKGGYSAAFAIQSAVLPMLLSGPKRYSGDICISAATGSGKTLAYVLPMVQSLRSKPVTRLRGLIIVPTRELVNQVRESLDLCSAGSGLKVATAVGSKSLKEEQAVLVEKGQRYDPEAYKAEQEKEIDEDEELMDWDFDKKFGSKDDSELFYDHVFEYTSKVDVLICTPGRLVEHIQSTTGFTLEHVQWLIIDEADRLLDESFQQWVDVVLPGLEYRPPPHSLHEPQPDISHLFRRREVRKIILSATMTTDIGKLMTLNLRRPKLVVLEGRIERMADKHRDTAIGDEGERIDIPATLQEYGIPISEHKTHDKPLYLIELLEPGSDPLIGVKHRHSPIHSKSSEASEGDTTTDSDDLSQVSESQSKPDDSSTLPAPGEKPSNHGTLIFTESNEQALRLARLLALLRPSWQIGTLTKSTAGALGRKTLAAFRKRKLSILIASDRASRGLDIPDLAQVINYDMPKSATSYVHRVGRTARAGKEGQATTLVLHNQGKWFWKDKSGIAKSEMLVRGLDKRVVRRNINFDVSEEERKKYEQALQTLGEEANG